MSSKNDEIRLAINEMNTDKARELLKSALSEADAQTYYLASLVAFDDKQRAMFLQKAIDLDPFHGEAYQALEKLKAPPTPVVQPASATPAPTKPAPPATPVPAKPKGLTADDGIALRMAFNKVGYVHPNNALAKDMNGFLSQVGIAKWMAQAFLWQV
jgi:hypothetical protein